MAIRLTTMANGPPLSRLAVRVAENLDALGGSVTRDMLIDETDPVVMIRWARAAGDAWRSFGVSWPRTAAEIDALIPP